MVLDSLKFWKKKEEPVPEPMGPPQWNVQPPMAGVEAPPQLGGEPQFGQGIETPVPPTTTFAPPGGFTPSQPSFAPPAPAMQTAPVEGRSHELEIISAKLDTIKAQLENINTRLANLERIAQGEQAPKGW
jgi:hypothetical protein